MSFRCPSLQSLEQHLKRRGIAGVISQNNTNMTFTEQLAEELGPEAVDLAFQIADGALKACKEPEGDQEIVSAKMGMLVMHIVAGALVGATYAEAGEAKTSVLCSLIVTSTIDALARGLELAIEDEEESTEDLLKQARDIINGKI